MALYQLVKYADVNGYREHYIREYCHGNIKTFVGISVYFSRQKIEHCFYESSQRDGIKDTFSHVRAQRIDWIKATLENSNADLYKGWIKREHRYNSARRVAVAYQDFVVIIDLSLKQNGNLKANFVTCFQAENSIGKIRTSPKWSLDDCLAELKSL